MKQTFGTFLLLMLLWLPVWSETSTSLNLISYKLDNGLTIFLNPDSQASTVYGMVVVKGGSKRDPKDATGIAHYFEHIMFKGTDALGTIDYQTEKIYLDSIEVEYDKLGKTIDATERRQIQLKINELSLKAAEFAIPNELDRIIQEMGGSSVNAFTSYDCIAYYNSFPAGQMEKWLELYSHRFINPVFRMFQSELETVYEEKNMYADDMGTPFIETLLKELFTGTPYGDHTILGKAEHLKNPSLSKMRDYFETYYVPNNMALILTGNFDPDSVAPMIEEKFSRLQYKPLPELPTYQLTPYKGRHQVKKRLMPIKIGVIGFHTVPDGHPDRVALDVCSNLLSNYSETGLLDELTNNNKWLESTIQGLYFEDLGGHFLIFVPKLVGQSLKKTERMAFNQLEKLKTGKFDDDLLEAVKTSMIKEKQLEIEEPESRAYAILNLYLHNQSWDDVLSYSEQVNSITREDVMRIASQYFGENHLVLHSRMGFPKKDKVEKPPYKPITPQNTEEKSEYALQLDSIRVIDAAPKFIEENVDYHYGKLAENADYYYVNNHVNKIFELQIKFRQGTIERPEMNVIANVFDNSGNGVLGFSEFRKELQKLGGEINASVDNNFFTITLTGLEQNIEPTLELVNTLLENPVLTDKAKKKIANSRKTERKLQQKDMWNQHAALRDYALYNSRSRFMQYTTYKEIKNSTPLQLSNLLREAMQRSADFHYTGTIGHERMATLLLEKFKGINNLQPVEQWFSLKPELPETPTVYFINNKKAVQSRINILIPATTNNQEDEFACLLFNEYFSANMNSIVFQEIREFRSLAYAATGRYGLPYDRTNPGLYIGFMSTQADKTIEALDAFTSLTSELPLKPERVEFIRNNLKLTIGSSRPPFRSLSHQIPMWKQRGFGSDPNKFFHAQIDDASFDTIEGFHANYMKNRPATVVIVGDKKRIDMKALEAQFGSITELQVKDVFRK